LCNTYDFVLALRRLHPLDEAAASTVRQHDGWLHQEKDRNDLLSVMLDEQAYM
jgi:hypothetical protein